MLSHIFYNIAINLTKILIAIYESPKPMPSRLNILVQTKFLFRPTTNVQIRNNHILRPNKVLIVQLHFDRLRHGRLAEIRGGPSRWRRWWAPLALSHETHRRCAGFRSGARTSLVPLILQLSEERHDLNYANLFDLNLIINSCTLYIHTSLLPACEDTNWRNWRILVEPSSVQFCQ